MIYIKMTLHHLLLREFRCKNSMFISPMSRGMYIHKCLLKNSWKNKKQVIRQEMWTCEHVLWLILLLFQSCRSVFIIFAIFIHFYGITCVHYRHLSSHPTCVILSSHHMWAMKYMYTLMKCLIFKILLKLFLALLAKNPYF